MCGKDDLTSAPSEILPDLHKSTRKLETDPPVSRRLPRPFKMFKRQSKKSGFSLKGNKRTRVVVHTLNSSTGRQRQVDL